MEQTALREDAPISFKALRAKFQEEALLAQSKSTRPAVADKPKHLPPPGGHCSPLVSAAGVDSKTLVVPRAIFRDGLWGSGGKRPISFPPQPHQACTPPQDEGTTTRQTLKERHMPLVLPVLPVKNQKLESPTEKEGKPETDLGKEVLPHTRVKKKGLLLPFKSARTSKFHAEDGEEMTYSDLTNRPASAPGELPSIEKQSVEDGVSLQSDQSTTEYPPSSPDIPRTPPPTEVRSNSDSRIFSTLEKAKRKFTPRQILNSTKPKRLNSPEYASREKAFPSSPKISDTFCSPAPIAAPACLPHLACISARPFFKNSSHKFVFERQHSRENGEGSSVKSAEPLSPLGKQLPELRTLGPPPAKPARPPLVDLSRYQTPIVKEESVSDLSKEQPLVPPSTSNPILDPPEIPDFDNSEIETDGEAVDIAAIELEALGILCSEIGMPAPCGVPGCEAPQPDLSAADPAETIESSIVRDLNLGSQNIIPLDPASTPEPINLPEFLEPSAPEQQSQSKEPAAESFSSSRSDETLSTVAKRQSVPEDLELSSRTARSDERQTQSSAHQQDGCHEAYDNLYEDVETVNKMMSGQVSVKQRATVKNPYAENRPLREEPCYNKRLRHPWSSAHGEHAPVHHHVHSKEHLSPNSADYKEQRKREKQRLERERKEQKEREKKENEMKKKFKVTGDEEPMYHAKVTVASKVRKHDLPVKSGDTVSIIRTTNCPKGKWLARDSNNKYGYISVMNVELDIKEMLELGKKAQAAGRGANQEGDTISIGSRSSSHPVMTSSFTDDSEEWACEDETLSPSNESHFPQQNSSLPETSCLQAGDASLEDLHPQNRHEALQKLAFFFQHNKDELGDFADGEGATPTNAEASNYLCAVEEPPYPEQEVDFTELGLLPPPPLYADSF
ncbi:uncharacterized protein si:ch211-188c16.1 isoform X2 [Oryzias melastigma]|uniref:uncharacterized protein si:ch211-188c16.1 isoform X2 n=1 Tax=Oryzias melastigma TaxID=30732 RepID=UPI000CF7E256|nr:uncharacterized protein si:ch211-188c16.1 isoform X2 [Oryzias melastigma]